MSGGCTVSHDRTGDGMMSDMHSEQAATYLRPQGTIERDGINVAKEIADKTVWDKLAEENPTHAVISAHTEAEAAEKSKTQIDDIKHHVRSDQVLLDLGAGYGRVAKYLLPDVTIRGYIAVDSSYQMLRLFKERYDNSQAEQKTPVLFVNADIHTLPVKDAVIDTAIVCAVFLHNHKATVKTAMEELTRVVRPGGTVLVYSSFPRTITLMGLQGHLYQMLLNLLGKPYKNGPVRYYTGKEIRHLFKDFTEVELRPHGFSVLPKTIIILPKPVEKIWRRGLANPINTFLEIITPARLKPYFAVHYDVIAKR